MANDSSHSAPASSSQSNSQQNLTEQVIAQVRLMAGCLMMRADKPLTTSEADALMALLVAILSRRDLTFPQLNAAFCSLLHSHLDGFFSRWADVYDPTKGRMSLSSLITWAIQLDTDSPTNTESGALRVKLANNEARTMGIASAFASSVTPQYRAALKSAPNAVKRSRSSRAKSPKKKGS